MFMILDGAGAIKGYTPTRAAALAEIRKFRKELPNKTWRIVNLDKQKGLKMANEAKENVGLRAENERLRSAIQNYLAVFDRCGGSESVAPKDFADARAGLRSAFD